MKSIIEEYTAQHNWKAHYKKAMEYRDLGILEQEYVYLDAAREFRREAALERIIARQAREIERLKINLQFAREQFEESEDRREFAARLEFGG